MGSHFGDHPNSTGNEFSPFRKEKNADVCSKQNNPIEVYYFKVGKHEFNLHLTWKLSLHEPSLARKDFTLVFISGSTYVKIIYKKYS